MKADPSPTPPEEPDPALGRALRRLREERGLGRDDLAQRSGIEPATLAKLEEGALDPPWTTVEAIARGLGASMQTLADATIAEEPAEES